MNLSDIETNYTEPSPNLSTYAYSSKDLWRREVESHMDNAP